MNFFKLISVTGIIASAFFAGVWWNAPSRAPASIAVATPEPVAVNESKAELPPLPKNLPALAKHVPADAVTESFGKSLPPIPMGEIPVPPPLKGQKGLLSQEALERVRQQMNSVGPDTVRFLRDDLRLSDRDIQTVSDLQRDMDDSLANMATQSKGREIGGQMRELFTTYTQKLENVMGKENTVKFHQFRSSQMRRIAEGSGMPAVPAL